MAEPRLTSGFWVRAYIARLRVFDIPAFITAHGDEDAGAIIIKLNTLDGQAKAFERAYGPMGDRIWAVFSEGPDGDVEAALARQKGRDPDLWIVEVEDRAGRHLLDEEGLG